MVPQSVAVVSKVSKVLSHQTSFSQHSWEVVLFTFYR